MYFIIIRTVILYIIVTVAIRLMGKRQIGDMQPNELVITLLISEIAAIPLQDTNQPVLLGIIAIFVLVILEICVSVLTMKSFSFRKIISGKSVVVIKNGVIDQQSMRDVRMTVLDLIELLRGKDVFCIDDVAFAVLEVNGDLSVMLKSEVMPVSKQDIKIISESSALPLPVISDGKLIQESLNALQIKKDEILRILNKENCTKDEIFLMSINRNGKYNLIKKENKI